MNAAPVLIAENLQRHYAVRRGLFAAPAIVRALSGVSLSLQPGRTLAVVGESGCGKSTLARLLTMIEPPTEGTLKIGGQDASTPVAQRALRGDIQIVFKIPTARSIRGRQ